jgi:hypothetical protein
MRRWTGAEDGWAGMPEELMAMVLELLQAGGLGFSQASATVRQVCARWKAVHDALVTRLVLSWRTTDEAIGTLVRRFPAVVSLEFKGNVYGESTALTDKGLLAVSSLPALTLLDLSYCSKLTDAGLRAVSNLPALASLNLNECYRVTNAGLLAVGNLPALTFLNLSRCNVTDESMQAVSSLPALTSLNLTFCDKVSDKGLRAVIK